MRTTPYHTPVLLQEVVSQLVTVTDGVYLDGTVGGGGHAEAVLHRLGASGMLVGLDVDDDALVESSRKLKSFGPRAVLRKSNFREIKSVLRELAIESVAGVFFDLGVSSYQLDEPSKGFSFRSTGKLDMRMDMTQALDAFQVVNGYPEKQLTEIFRDYGEERNARRLARLVVQRRSSKPIRTPLDLTTVLEKSINSRYLTKTLARIFQAIRIEVNNELDNLRDAVSAAVDVLQPMGRLVVISYHSLEDRIVKEIMKADSATLQRSAHPLLPDMPLSPKLKILTKKPIEPGLQERRENPRARSAKLRAAEKTVTP